MTPIKTSIVPKTVFLERGASPKAAPVKAVTTKVRELTQITVKERGRLTTRTINKIYKKKMSKNVEHLF